MVVTLNDCKLAEADEAVNDSFHLLRVKAVPCNSRVNILDECRLAICLVPDGCNAENAVMGKEGVTLHKWVAIRPADRAMGRKAKMQDALVVGGHILSERLIELFKAQSLVIAKFGGKAKAMRVGKRTSLYYFASW